MNIADYVAVHYNRRMVRDGPRAYKTECIFPDHPERKPSFYCYVDDNSYYCHGCKRAGDFLDLILFTEFNGEATKENWREVFKRLEELGATPLERSYVPAPTKHKVANGSERKAMTIAYRHYKRELARSPLALAYLKSRGLRDPLALPVGYCSGNPSAFAALVDSLKAGVADWREVAIATGLLWDDGGERLKGRIPVFEIRRGEVVYMQARSLDPDANRRYLNPRDMRKCLLGVETLAIPRSPIVVVEGPFDALPLIEARQPVVALMGTGLVELQTLVGKAEHRPVAVMSDDDDGGEEIARLLIPALKDAGVQAYRFRPRHNDPSAWAAEEGTEAILAALGCSSTLTLGQPDSTIAEKGA